ncbi:unnamed protein product, partial [Mycena citricolor]
SPPSLQSLSDTSNNRAMAAPPPPNASTYPGAPPPNAPGGFSPFPPQPYGAQQQRPSYDQAPQGYPSYGQQQYPPPPGAYPPPPGAPGSYPPPPGAPGSYPPPPGAPGAYAPPPGSFGAYGPPPGAPGAYPPPPGTYGPPPGAPPGGYVAPPGAYPPPPGAYGAYTPPPQPGYAPSYAPPPGQAPYVPPPGGYAPPPALASFPSAPGSVPAAGAPSVQEYPTTTYRGATIHNPKYAGGISVYNYTADAIARDINDLLRNQSDEKGLAETLGRFGALKMEVIAQEFPKHTSGGESLHRWVERKTTRYTEAGCLGLVLGPLRYDMWCVEMAIRGAGTDEDRLDEVVMSLTPHDLDLLSYVYKQKYHKPLAQAILDDLSGDVQKLYRFMLDPARPYIPAPTASMEENRKLLEEDVADVYNSGPGRPGTNEDKMFMVLTRRTHEHLIQICRRYAEKHHKPLSSMIKSEFSGHSQRALLFLITGAEPHPRHSQFDPEHIRDAIKLEDTMAGFGTKDALLVFRMLRAHWNPQRMTQVAMAYRAVYDKDLLKRIKGETSGSFEKLLLSLLKGPVP